MCLPIVPSLGLLERQKRQEKKDDEKRHRSHIDSRSEVQIDIDFGLKACLGKVAAYPDQDEKASIGQQVPFKPSR